MYSQIIETTKSTKCMKPCRPHMTNKGAKTAFRHKHFKKSKHFFRSEVSWCDQTGVDLQLHRSTCLTSRISTQKEPFLRSEFTPGYIRTYWILINRQMQILHEVLLITMVTIKKKWLKNSFEKWKNLNFLGDLWVILINTFSTTHWRMPVWKLQTWSRLRNVRQGDALKLVPTRTPCVYRYIVPARWGDV